MALVVDDAVVGSIHLFVSWVVVNKVNEAKCDAVCHTIYKFPKMNRTVPHGFWLDNFGSICSF